MLHVAVLKRMVPMEFEKDDDLNDHINFIAACSVSWSPNVWIAMTFVLWTFLFLTA